jgi:hypothetical protein
LLGMAASKLILLCAELNMLLLLLLLLLLLQ